MPDQADQLRAAMVDRLRADGYLTTPRVEAALRSVPRHLFVPGAPLAKAYADEVVCTKYDDQGVPISAASQPAIVSSMLEQLDVSPRHRVLEIGAGTGYNAALLAHLVGAAGQVTTIDVDPDLVEAARSCLDDLESLGSPGEASTGTADGSAGVGRERVAGLAGAGRVRVVLGDGALGRADGAPYDRIIATVGAWDLPPAWLAQLAPDGRLVVPLRLRGSVTRSIAFERSGDHWYGVSSQMCGFMPLRGGAADDPHSGVRLDPGISLQVGQEQVIDATALAGVFDRPRTVAWTGAVFDREETTEWLELWLACSMDNAVSRMFVERPAIDSGQLEPQYTWGAMAIVDGPDLAYLTSRPAGDAVEVGVIGHGAAHLAARVSEAVAGWDQHYRSRTARFAIQPVGAAAPITGRFTFRTPNNLLAVDWH